MIHYLTCRGNAYTVRDTCLHWRPELLKRIRFIAYEDLPRVRTLVPGAVVFSDLERLTPMKRRLALAFARRLRAGGFATHILNAPEQALMRYDLLHALADGGVNRFRVYKYKPGLKPARFPVFIRWEHAHSGSIGALLASQAELDSALQAIVAKPAFPLAHLLVVEFCDTADGDGIYRKYGATRIGPQLIPRHVFLSKNWMLKNSDIVNDETVEEERRFFTEFPHRAAVMAAFERAGIAYGRMDYAVKDGGIQVWEINTNPSLAGPREKIPEPRRALQEQIVNAMLDGFVALDEATPTGPSIRPFALRHLPLAWAYRVRDRLPGRSAGLG